MTDEQRGRWLGKLAFYIGEEDDNGTVLMTVGELRELYDMLLSDSRDAAHDEVKEG